MGQNTSHSCPPLVIPAQAGIQRLCLPLLPLLLASALAVPWSLRLSA